VSAFSLLAPPPLFPFVSFCLLVPSLFVPAPCSIHFPPAFLAPPLPLSSTFLFVPLFVCLSFLRLQSLLPGWKQPVAPMRCLSYHLPPHSAMTRSIHGLRGVGRSVRRLVGRAFCFFHPFLLSLSLPAPFCTSLLLLPSARFLPCVSGCRALFSA
jgi:hypothetical protein